MVFIGAAQQNRLFEVAKQHLGRDGDAVLREIIRNQHDVPMDQVTYPQLFSVFKSIERTPPAQLGRAPALALAAGLRGLCEESETGLRGRLSAALSKRLGPAADPFLENVCSGQGLLLATLDKRDLPAIAQSVRGQAALLLGSEAAEGLFTAVMESASARPAELAPKVLALITTHLGADGPNLLRSLCRGRLEVEIEDLDADGIMQLARLVETDGPAHVGAARAAVFVTAARQSVTSPAEELRRKVLALTKQYIGPVGEDFAKDVCDSHGLPFRAVDYEHLMWLAEVLRGEAVPIIGKKDADDLARGVRALLTGKA